MLTTKVLYCWSEAAVDRIQAVAARERPASHRLGSNLKVSWAGSIHADQAASPFVIPRGMSSRKDVYPGGLREPLDVPSSMKTESETGRQRSICESLKVVGFELSEKQRQSNAGIVRRFGWTVRQGMMRDTGPGLTDQLPGWKLKTEMRPSGSAGMLAK